MNNNIKITQGELVCNHQENIDELKTVLAGTRGKLNYICEICNCKIITKWTKRGRFLISIDERDNTKINKQVPTET